MFRLSFVRSSALLACSLACSTGASAADLLGADLAKARNCLACHQIDTKRVGPAYQSVAQRYADQPDALAKLEQSIHRGSANKWGKIPMPAQSQLTPAEAKQLATWILSLKK